MNGGVEKYIYAYKTLIYHNRKGSDRTEGCQFFIIYGKIWKKK